MSRARVPHRQTATGQRRGSSRSRRSEGLAVRGRVPAAPQSTVIGRPSVGRPPSVSSRPSAAPAASQQVSRWFFVFRFALVSAQRSSALGPRPSALGRCSFRFILATVRKNRCNDRGKCDSTGGHCNSIQQQVRQDKVIQVVFLLPQKIPWTHRHTHTHTDTQRRTQAVIKLK